MQIVREVRALYRTLKPDLAHHVAVQASVVGSLAATRLPIVCVNAITGLGTAFLGNNLKAQMARPMVTLLLRALLNRDRSAVLVQNPDDRAVIERLGISADRIALVPGSGVDIERLTPSPEPAGAITVAFAGRLVEDKGIRTLIAAHDILMRRGRDIRLLIAGVPDPANPTSIPPRELETWCRPSQSRPSRLRPGHRGLLGLRAHRGAAVAARGTAPHSVEAAACGRPLVATDVPGCREIARDGLNALLVPPDDAQALANAIDRLAADPDLRARFGRAGRELVEREFSSQRIGREVVALYRRLLQPSECVQAEMMHRPLLARRSGQAGSIADAAMRRVKTSAPASWRVRS